MAAQRSLEPLILVRIRAPLPLIFEMISVPDEDPHLGVQPNSKPDKPRAILL